MSDNQTSVGNTVLIENDVIKQLAELKDKVEKMSVVKEKDPVTNFHVTEYVLHPTSSTSFKTFKHTVFEGDNDPRSHLSEFLRVSQMNRSDEEGKMPVKIEIEKSITVKVGDVPEEEDEQIQLAIQKSLVDQEEQWYYSSEEDVNELVEGKEFMMGMTQASTESEWSKKISEFEDFLGIGDEASKMVQEQKSKARILQSVLVAKDAEEAERKALKMMELGAEAIPEEEEDASADEVI
ncbi:hypothetical protein JCGZ_21003 [Jatropha curcas]|uniref:Uncharacterized protein n=1 Tax=Jatropha curcas TaxID=180498 RepID=A0A067L853_JATCU|nr:hypothetical protein JCGZ_21003 [Jatropha curcas]